MTVINPQFTVTLTSGCIQGPQWMLLGMEGRGPRRVSPCPQLLLSLSASRSDTSTMSLHQLLSRMLVSPRLTLTCPPVSLGVEVTGTGQDGPGG